MFVILVSFLLFASISAVPYQDCGSTINLQSVDISNCTTPPCKVVIGSSFNVTLKFESDAAYENALKLVYYVINEIEVPIDGVTSPNCSEDGCSIDQGENILSAEIAVSPSLPPVHGDFAWELYNGNQKIICFIVPVAIHPS